MTISPAAATSGADPTGDLVATKRSRMLDKEAFLQLLVTQLSNQDPLNPMKGQEFAAQLAQFSAVEQLTNINSTLEAQGQLNGILAQSINSGVAAGLLGKHVEAAGNRVTWSGDALPRLDFSLDAPSEAATLTIRDASGGGVLTKELGSLDAGDHQVQWNGMNEDGEAVPTGAYTYEISAQDAAGESVEATTGVSGLVDRVTFGQDGILLWIGDTAVPLAKVRSVESAPA